MFFFYAYEKAWLRTDEIVIWSQSYFDTGWQALFDTFHSLPLLAIFAVLSWRTKLPRAAALFASMTVHALCDLALHHHDAHRHLFPFSDWRFLSPVSYWDPRHYGGIASAIETVLVVAGSVWLLRSYKRPAPRVFLMLILLSYAFFIGYALVVWA